MNIRANVIKIYDATFSALSGSFMLNVKADDGSLISINLNTQQLRFASGSDDHGFGFRVSGNSVFLETPQSLTSGSNVIFRNIKASGSIHTDKIYSKNKFILMNSGSATGDGGIVIRSGSNYSGTAMGWDNSSKRFGVRINDKLHVTASALTPEAYISNVIDINNGHVEKPLLQKSGNIRISGSDVYIWI